METLLEQCLDKTRIIKELDEQIAELRARATSPKNQIITGMPRGGGGGNQSERYMERLERIEARRRKVALDRGILWNKVLDLLAFENTEYHTMLWCRFFRGMRWNAVCDFLKENYPNSKWNMNKVFRIYRQILRKFS